MKELSHKVKEKVIRLFVDGTPYNKISDQLDIAKGSVVNIIDDLREGRLSLPVDMTEHVSELRTLVIDLKKHQISVGQMKVYLKLHKKLKNMGVDCENVEEWVDIFQNIAGSNDSNDHFIETVYDLAQLSKEAGQDLREFVCEYEEKLGTRAEIDNQMEEKKQQLQEIEQEYQEESEKIKSQISNMTRELNTIQEANEKRKKEMESQLQEYLVDNKLSWEKVNTVLAVAEDRLTKEGLNSGEIDDISRQIRKAGSLSSVIKQLEGEMNKLQTEVSELTREKRTYFGDVDKLTFARDTVTIELLEKQSNLKNLATRLQSAQIELNKLKEMISQYAHDLHMAVLITTFLLNPSKLDNNNYDRLLGLMIAIRHSRQGNKIITYRDQEGSLLCECPVPKMYHNLIPISGIDIENARGLIALYLTPLVKDKFISIPEHKVDKAEAIINAIAKERSKKLQ